MAVKTSVKIFFIMLIAAVISLLCCSFRFFIFFSISAFIAYGEMLESE